MTRVAAIDCGTNSVRLLVADLPDDRAGALDEVVRRMEIVRLGQDVDRTGMLAPEALERTRVALAAYAEQLEALGAERVRMVATSATRDAANADEFRDMVVRTIGVAPEVVSGDEEARLSFSGAVVGLPGDTPAPYLVVDIGGGSTEFVVGHHTVDAAVSVDIGCVRMTERHLHADPAEPDQIAAAEADIMAGVEQALAAVPAERARALVGLAGSVTTVAALALELDSYRPDLIHHAVIRYEDVASITWRLLGLSRAERLRLPVMHPGRADVIGAGALVLAVIMRRLGMGSVIASEHDILDGICYSLLR